MYTYSCFTVQHTIIQPCKAAILQKTPQNSEYQSTAGYIPFPVLWAWELGQKGLVCSSTREGGEGVQGLDLGSARARPSQKC